MSRFDEVVGDVLRRARRARGLTLHDVRRLSRGRFKPSALGAYERGERRITLDRFCDLAGVYGLAPEQLLADVLDRLAPGDRASVVIDLNRLQLIPGEEGRLVAEYVHAVKARRGDYLTDVITLRSGDLAALALSSGRKPRDLLRKLDPAIRPEGRKRR